MDQAEADVLAFMTFTRSQTPPQNGSECLKELARPPLCACQVEMGAVQVAKPLLGGNIGSVLKEAATVAIPPDPKSR
jgi:hypothetical protein